jgi:glutamyl-tRNA reductase
VAISTCNRTEVYLVVGDAVEAETTVLGMLARQAGIRPTELAEAIYAVRNCDAARHLFRVTAGLESMIIGEAEVQGQVKRAYELALSAGVTGPLTNRMFGAALATGKRVRSETGISQRRVSVPSVAVDLAQETIGALGKRRVVVLGTGEMAELTARALAERGVHTVFIANRRRERALALAEQFEGRVAGMDDMPVELEAADIVLASTASPHPIVGSDELSLVMQERGGRPLLLIDIAVPRDVDPLCAELPGVTLYDVDDLQAVVARNLQVRAAEARAADAIVEEEIKRFAGWLGSLEVLPTISALRAHGEDIVASVLAENESRFDAGDRERVRALARAVMQRLLHEPTLRMKGGGDGRTHARMQLVRELFGLEDAEEETAADAEPADVRELPAQRPARRPR